MSFEKLLNLGKHLGLSMIRSTNKVADWLASFKNSEMSVFTWVNQPLSSMFYILNKDGLSCPH